MHCVRDVHAARDSIHPSAKKMKLLYKFTFLFVFSISTCVKDCFSFLLPLSRRPVLVFSALPSSTPRSPSRGSSGAFQRKTMEETPPISSSGVFPLVQIDNRSFSLLYNASGGPKSHVLTDFGGRREYVTVEAPAAETSTLNTCTIQSSPADKHNRRKKRNAAAAAGAAAPAASRTLEDPQTCAARELIEETGGLWGLWNILQQPLLSNEPHPDARIRVEQRLQQLLQQQQLQQQQVQRQQQEDVCASFSRLRLTGGSGIKQQNVSAAVAAAAQLLKECKKVCISSSTSLFNEYVLYD